MIVNFVWPSSAQYTGGVVVLYRFANGLAQRGVDVRFIHGPKTPWRVDRVEDIAWFDFDERIRHHIVDDVDDPSIEPGDVVMSPVAPARFGLPVAIIQGHQMLGEAWERKSFRTPGLKVVVASWLTEVGGRYGVPEDRFAVVPVGIDHDLFRVERGPSDRPIDVAMLYNRHPSKGWETGIDALERVRAVRTDLSVTAFSIVEPSHELPHWVDLSIDPPRETLALDVLNRSKVFLQPSIHEGLGLTAIEAQACGCALVTTDNGGSRDYAEDGVTALVGPAGDAGALAEAVLRLLGDDEERTAIASAGTRGAARYDWDRAADVLHRHLIDYVADPDRHLAAIGPDTTGSSQDPDGWSIEDAVAAVTAEVEQDRARRDALVRPAPILRRSAAEAREEDLIWNVVWTGTVFDRLKYFVASQMAHTTGRFRFVLNGCAPGEIEKMQAFQARHPDRVVEVLHVFDDMLAHGQALDAVLAARDDGPCFSLIDPDIKASGPFAADLLALLPGHGAVTSAKEIWNENSVLPPDEVGVAGEYFFDQDGFVFGSPHLGIYDRAALDRTRERWSIGLGSAGPELGPEVVEHMATVGRSFLVLDTCKVANILLTADGFPILHREHPSLLHIGGLSHYISPSGYITKDGRQEPEWARWERVAPRLEVARYTANLLTSSIDRSDPAPMPVVDDEHLREALPKVRDAVLDLVDRYRGWMPETDELSAGSGSGPSGSR